MTKAPAQRLILGALSLALLVGCGQADAVGAAESAPQTSTPDASSPAEASATPTESTATVATLTASDEALRVAVQGYSDGFLGGDPTTAYGYFSARCQEQVSLSYFTGIVTAAKRMYGAALPIASYEAQASGDLARVTYTYDVPALNQTDEPWAREAGAWKQDDC